MTDSARSSLPPPNPSPRRVLLLVAASALLLAAAAVAVWLMPAAAHGAPASARADAVAAVAPTDRWMWPVAQPIAVLAPFRAPPTPYAAGHRGIDLAAASGDPVFAPAAGVIRFAGPVAGRGVVSIDHGGGVVSAVEPVESAVAAGTAVSAGRLIGAVARGGHCDAVCVHFGVRVDGEYVSPFLFLGGLPRAVLLPMP